MRGNFVEAIPNLFTPLLQLTITTYKRTRRQYSCPTSQEKERRKSRILFVTLSSAA
ncbi:hypothetical protein SK128_017779 [Halocaridina rubra]|uniref:Uncharacterized protein n=1 Tax=Halocaridina rubra TaxID=373956 RepID=A0AAN9AFQ3_HALRR